MKQFWRGLVVGKFCPLHYGHESVISRALELCEEVFVISYTNPEFAGCEPAKRRSWLALRFPQVRALVLDSGCGIEIPANDAEERIHRRFVGKLCREELGLSVDAVFTSEGYGDGFASELSEYLREGEPGLPPVRHVLVDPGRAAWPVSGTRLREDIHACREFLAPEVYASFVERVALLGGESSGKTTLAAALAEEWRTEWVAEFGRELWEDRGGKLEARDMPEIVHTQVAREEAACLRAQRFVFCDSVQLTTLFYSKELFGSADRGVTMAASRRYHHTVLCAPDFPFVQDGTRRDAAFAQYQHDWYVARLGRGGIDYLLAEGSLAERVSAVSRYLERVMRARPVVG